MKSVILTLILALSIQATFAQSDSIRSEKPAKKPFFKHEIVPLSLITAGSLLNIGTIKTNLGNALPQTHTTTEDYLQYTPMAEMYLFDVLGLSHQNTVFDQTKYLIITQLTSGLITQTLKMVTKVLRPNGARTSFPSGHTTLAFAGATVLFHEFKDTDPWAACSGFVIATATGYLRLTNRKHWVPDVLTGAGIGILTADAVYYLKPLKKLELKSGKGQGSFFPAFGYKSLSLACRF